MRSVGSSTGWARVNMSDTLHWKAGQLIAERYRIDRFLDEGGAGEVYAAENVWTARQVAVKRLLPDHLADATLVERFLLEGRIGGRIEHPNIVQVLDMGKEPGDQSLFIVQELLHGQSLRALIEKRGRLQSHEALDLVIPILGALVAVHQQGIVHRDIKPENIFVLDAPFGHQVPKLLDFGIAKVRLDSTLTRAGSVMGTLGYMPPEQLEGAREVDRRADIWSIGIVLYELLAGAHPFDADSYVEALDKIMRRQARPLHDIVPHCPLGLSQIVDKTLRKSRQERPDSMLAVLEEVLRWSRLEPDESLHSLVSRHRLSIPSSLVQRILAPQGSVMPPPLWATLAAERRRLSQSSAPQSHDPRAEVDIEVEFDISSHAPPSNPESDDTIIDLRDAVLAVRAAQDQARSAVAAEPVAKLPSSDTDPADLPPESVLKVHSHAALAAEALRGNDFATAGSIADGVVSTAVGDPELQASMRLLQAQCSFWVGDVAMHEAHAFDAFHLSVPGSATHMQAAAELACASSTLGEHQRLLELVDDFGLVPLTGDVMPEYLVACCRLGIALQRAGWPEHVERVVGKVQGALHSFADAFPEVRAWSLMLRAELADHAGDHAHSLVLARDAVSAFEQRGDKRWSCICQAAVGYSTLLLGGYEQARTALSSAIAEASSAGISQAEVLRLHLGLALTRDGDLGQGVESLRSSVLALQSSPDVRVRSVSHLYLAEALILREDFGGGEVQARAAVELAQPAPALRARALAMLAMVLMPRPMEALMAASQAMEVLSSLGGVAEDEARIRLAYAMALDALGHTQRARDALAQAHSRLVERAARISDPTWRASFLHRVPDHARTITLAAARNAIASCAEAWQ